MWGKKKIKQLINNDLTFCFVTSEVEKSNFYKDLVGLLNWDDSARKRKKENENELKQKRE
jgi:hypothetical protein